MNDTDPSLPASRIHVIVADDHPMVRTGLQIIIDSEQDMRVAGQACDAASTLAALHATACDVLLLDLCMPGATGTDLIRDILREKPGLPVLMVSMHGEPRLVRAALQAGARGYVTKNCLPDILTQAVRTLHAGRSYLDPQLAQAMAVDPGATTSPRDLLSPRELEVLCRLAIGQSNNEIARAISLSEKTVSTHKTNLMTKLGLHGVADLVRYADQHFPDELVAAARARAT